MDLNLKSQLEKLFENGGLNSPARGNQDLLSSGITLENSPIQIDNSRLVRLEKETHEVLKKQKSNLELSIKSMELKMEEKMRRVLKDGV